MHNMLILILWKFFRITFCGLVLCDNLKQGLQIVTNLYFYSTSLVWGRSTSFWGERLIPSYIMASMKFYYIHRFFIFRKWHLTWTVLENMQFQKTKHYFKKNQVLYYYIEIAHIGQYMNILHHKNQTTNAQIT